MLNNTKILNRLGFIELPHDISEIKATFNDTQKWLTQINFDTALDFYNLNTHNQFSELFNEYLLKFKSSHDMQNGAYILFNYLFSADKYNWTHNLKRKTTDFLPALILISGYSMHEQNMKNRKFDEYQINKHIYRIYETCIRGIDIYKINGTEISQLIWGSFFINAHIIEIGRLQYELFMYDYQIPGFQPKNKFCINMHVPRGQKLSNESVSKSLETAKEQIPFYFHEIQQSPDIFIESWLMDKNLEPHLPEKSNIRLFRNRFNILHQLPESSISKFLFNTSSSDISKYPSNTYLRHKIKTALLNGEKFYDGIALLKQQNIK